MYLFVSFIIWILSLYVESRFQNSQTFYLKSTQNRPLAAQINSSVDDLWSSVIPNIQQMHSPLCTNIQFFPAFSLGIGHRFLDHDYDSLTNRYD